MFLPFTAAVALGLLAKVQHSICASVIGFAVEVSSMASANVGRYGYLATKWEVRKRFGSMGLLPCLR